jgi:acetyl-CoA acyltransferase
MSDAYVIASVRTAVGKAKRGALARVRPEALAAEVLRGVLDRVEGLSGESLDDVLLGCAMPEGTQGMNIARIAVHKAGLPDGVPAATVNRFCSSGLQTIAMGAQAIRAGEMDLVLGGGIESMSAVPMGGLHFLPDPELVRERPDAYLDMGNCTENVAERYGVSREDADAFALRSHERALAAIDEGLFAEEIVPVPVRVTAQGDEGPVTTETVFDVDEGPRRDTSLEGLAKLRPVFRHRGTITAGNASQVSDGAAASIVASEAVVRELGVEPMARLVGYAVAGVPPEVMGMGPVPAVRKVLDRSGVKLSDVGLVELNEAFAVQSLAVIRELDLDEEIVNVHGGAIALGHPLGCTGAKLTATLLHAMRRRGVRYGLCTMCVGGGMGAAGLFENLAA